MKKLIIFILISLIVLLSGCSIQEKLDFDITEVNIKEGELYQLTPKGDLTGVEYEIEDVEIATVNFYGLIRGVKQGETTLTATYNKKSVTIEIFVSYSEVTLEFNVEDITFEEGDLFQLKPSENITGIVYEAMDVEIATVNSFGLVRANNEGKTSVKATYKNVTVIIEVNVLKKTSEPDDEVKNLTVHYIDVGQADAIFIELPNGETMMIDAGWSNGTGYKEMGWNNIIKTLDAIEFDKIDHFVISHNHQDHYGFVPDIIERYGIVNIYGSGSTRTNTQYLNIVKSIENAGLEYYVVEVGDILVQTDNLMIQVVATNLRINEPYPNYNSVMMRLVYGTTSFMFTGDGGFKTSNDGENIALASGLDLSADVLKVGHHGSSDSSGVAFLNAVMPRYAIFTTRENSSDGLPKGDAISRILAVGATIYQSKDHGTIIVVSDGENITIYTEK